MRAIVRGRVQGVGYRWFVRERARDLGIGGWVRNREDGSVEVYAEGSRESLDRLSRMLRSGPAGAEVADVNESADDGIRSSEAVPFPFAIRR